jgi:chemotaxis protein methyltransferase CheR
MILREHFPQLASWNIRFVATDISTQILDRGREGRYSQTEVNRGLPASYLVKYFEKHRLGWRIRADLRNSIEFRRLNLIETWPVMPKMDIIFMRNVLIYFSVETKKAILQKVRRQIMPDGYYFMGGAETTLNVDDSFHRVQFDRCVCYSLEKSQ